ncbi:MAG: hypothetical protein RL722_2305 [Pseudomonadota bacterium]|jgi:nicotinamide riboside kinase
MRSAFVVTLVGAESTGKSTLAQALAERARAQGLHAVAVAEYLREFCEQAGRTPRADEQAAIAAEQSARIAAAAAEHELVIADTSALMIAVYSDYLFGDTSLHALAMAAHRRTDLTLLTALDLPWQADGMRDGDHVRQPVDQRIRRALLAAGLGWSVVAGSGPQRLEQAWSMLTRARNAWLTQDPVGITPPTPALPRAGTDPAATPGQADCGHGGWRHLCQRCGDGDCERRLFALASRPG